MENLDRKKCVLYECVCVWNVTFRIGYFSVLSFFSSKSDKILATNMNTNGFEQLSVLLIKRTDRPPGKKSATKRYCPEIHKQDKTNHHIKLQTNRTDGQTDGQLK